MFQFGNVLFRPIEKQDLELLHIWENDSELMMYSRSRPLNSVNMTQLEKQFDEWMKEEKNLQFIVELVGTKEPIGIARLEQRDWGDVKTGHIGTYIAKKELWGKRHRKANHSRSVRNGFYATECRTLRCRKR